MQPKKTHTNRNRTLIILLGILLAFVLTLSASASLPNQNVTPEQNSEISEKTPDFGGKILTIVSGLIKTFGENLHL